MTGHESRDRFPDAKAEGATIEPMREPHPESPKTLVADRGANRRQKRYPFPNPVNETSARIVAAGVVLTGAAYVSTGYLLLLLALTYGFLARVSTGPAFSPLALLATRVLTPRIKKTHRMVPGPPKRFAPLVGLLFSAAACTLYIADMPVASRVAVLMLTAAAFLEAAFGLCLGCIMFSWLIKAGLVPERICAECANLGRRP